jgi:hypothetical protein
MAEIHTALFSKKRFQGQYARPGTVAHEHHSFFFPDNGHGAANAAGFGWRNGG